MIVTYDNNRRPINVGDTVRVSGMSESFSGTFRFHYAGVVEYDKDNNEFYIKVGNRKNLIPSQKNKLEKLFLVEKSQRPNAVKCDGCKGKKLCILKDIIISSDNDCKCFRKNHDGDCPIE
jgi:hypothetical protein